MFIAITQAGWYLIGATSLFLLIFTLFILFYYRVQVRKNEFMLKEEQMRFHYQEQLLQTQLEIQEQTLKTISQEIHDNIGQALTLAKLNLSTIPAVEDIKLQQKVVNSKELIGKAIGDLRDLSHSLDTDYVQEMGFQRAVEYELERIQKSGVIDTIMEVQGIAYRLGKQKELIVFRIIQEAFNNILKHAEAKSMKVSINYLPGSLELAVADDGKGMVLADQPAGRPGLGTRNMQSRAQLIGAGFDFSSIPGKGTAITIFLPIESNTHAAKQ